MMLYYPTLNLYLYDLQEGLGQTDEEIAFNTQQFLKKLPENTQLLKNEHGEDYFELAPNRIIQLPKTPEFNTDDGYYYPVQLFRDSYGLLVNCSLAGNFDSQDLTWLKELQHFIARSVNNQAGTLGQTWIFSAQIENIPNDDELIKSCTQILCPKKPFKTMQWEDKIIFEINDPHTIIIFFTSKQSLKQENTYFVDWIHLLFYRHKINWAYQQSRQLVKQLKQQTKQIRIHENYFSQNIRDLEKAQLQDILNSLQFNLSYITHLKYLDAQAKTIQTNVDNYQKRLPKLSQRMGHKLQLFERFHEFAQQKYILQIEHEHMGFKAELEQLTKLIEFIQAINIIQGNGNIYIEGNISESSINTGNCVKQSTKKIMP